MQYPKTRNTGSVWPRMPQPTGQVNVDLSFQSAFQSQLALRQMLGVVIGPQDSLATAIASCSTGDTIYLLPGVYDAKSTIVVNKRLTLQGFGATIAGTGLLLDVAFAECIVRGVGFDRQDRVAVGATCAAVRLSADACLIADCSVLTLGPRGIQVDGDYCSAQGNRFMANPLSAAGDSNVYWSDNATNGTACGNMWGRDLGWVLDYRAIDVMSEAANGAAAIINVR